LRKLRAKGKAKEPSKEEESKKKETKDNKGKKTKLTSRQKRRKARIAAITGARRRLGSRAFPNFSRANLFINKKILQPSKRHLWNRCYFRKPGKNAL
jgi:hypothetical protein